MPTNQTGDGTRSFMGAEVPNNHKEAMLHLSHAKTTVHSKRTLSDEVRDAVAEYLAEHWDELPPEARDLLDDDLVANAGGDMEAADVEADA